MMAAPSRESLIASIGTGTELTEDLIKLIYSFELDYLGFSGQAIAALEAAGHPKARQCYDDWVKAYESARDAELKEVAHWWRMECDRQWEKKQRERNINERGETQLSEKEELLMKQALLLDQKMTLLKGLSQKQKGNLNR